MKNILYIVFICFFLISCTSKKDININKKSSIYYLNTNVQVLAIKKDVDSPFSFVLGLGGLISKNVGLSTSGSYTPKNKNSTALKLESQLLFYKIDISKLIVDEMNKQLLEHEFYKNKLSQNKYNHIIHLSLLSYDLDKSMFSNKYQIKLKIKLSILNLNNKIVYENTEEYKYDSDYDVYIEETIFENKENLEKVFLQSIKLNIKELINEMNKV